MAELVLSSDDFTKKSYSEIKSHGDYVSWFKIPENKPPEEKQKWQEAVLLAMKTLTENEKFINDNLEHDADLQPNWKEKPIKQTLTALYK